ncbi:hypothetical protein AMELA_G00191130 [Ameiurus melas]|uniref:Uncharacterized protein n=1 Tax=Ameiurus melas TaxID=219545 RepID=A0A7J6AB40_AMEME|nr:hypothetical protein AMELA_G00191130 [Ameiurus melas]
MLFKRAVVAVLWRKRTFQSADCLQTQTSLQQAWKKRGKAFNLRENKASKTCNNTHLKSSPSGQADRNLTGFSPVTESTGLPSPTLRRRGRNCIKAWLRWTHRHWIKVLFSA